MNSPYNQAQLQLGWTCYMFRKQFPSIPIRGAFVMRLHQNGVATYPLRSWVMNKANRKRALAMMRIKRMQRPVVMKRTRSRFVRVRR